MSTSFYSEDQLVEQPAIGLFAALGWQTVWAKEVNPLHSEIATLGQQIQNLRRARDLLLPRLLSGQVAVDALTEAIFELPATPLVQASGNVC
jgi:hypothetical protein